MECSPYRLAALLCGALEVRLAETRAGVPSRLAVYPHEAPAIEFCADGMAWVSIGAIRPVNSGSACALSWEIDLTAGVARCYPVVDGNAAPPVPAVDSAARDILDDGEAMRRAVVAAFDDEEAKVTGWRPMAPLGSAHGSTMSVTVRVGWGTYVEPRSALMPGDPRT